MKRKYRKMNEVHILKCDRDGDLIFTRTEMLCVSSIYQVMYLDHELTAACGGAAASATVARMTEPRFIHLRLHSAYSLLEGAIPVKALPKLCAEAGMPAVALTDTGNLFAALEFSEAPAKAGIQPIMGCQLALAYAEPAHPGDRAPAPRPIVLLAQDETGFGNLMKLSSLNYLDCGAALPHVTLDDARRPRRGADLPDRRRRGPARRS